MVIADKVNPLVLLLMLQGSFSTSQLWGAAQPFEVVPFQLDSDALRVLAPMLLENSGDRQAFCQAFAGKPAQLVAIVAVDKEVCNAIIRRHTEAGAQEASRLFGDEFWIQQTEMVVSIDAEKTSDCDRILQIIGDNVVMSGVSPVSLGHKLAIIRGHLLLWRHQELISLERKQWQSPCDQAPA